MSKVTYTPEQLKAIYESGKHLLVSASAGSGKTTVLIERILQKIKNENCHIDELLIVTFTEAAAFELKQRLRVKLTKALLEDSSHSHLRMQLPKLANAHISTFHSFCNQVIQKFFYLIDVEPTYKISDDIEILLLAFESIDECFEDCFEKKDEQFLLVVDYFSTKTHDDALKNLIKDIYFKLRSLPFKQEFIKKALDNYEVQETIDSWNLYPLFKQEVLEKISEAHTSFIKAKQLAEEVGHPYSEQFNEDEQIINQCKTSFIHRFDTLYRYLNDLSFPKLKSVRKDEVDEVSKDMIKSFRENGKNIIKTLAKKDFAFRERSQLKFLRENKKVLEALFYMIELFEKRFDKAKREKNLVDFSDLEEMTLKIFSVNNGENDATSYYKNQFSEILIDEFQDTNSMQETIINYISRGNNLFMVGDVKQSIYRFRSAEPDIFQSKYKNYQNLEGGELINLNANYRSREEVINFINYLFSQLMDEEVGEIEYDDNAKLVYGQKTYSNEKINEKMIKLTLLEKNKINESKEKSLEKSEMEAIQIAKEIRQIIDNETLIYDFNEKALRKVTYKDIVILSRTKGNQDTYHDVFKKYHIPFLVSDLSGYFDSIEVITVISILKIIDNPLQDIPLVAVLRSPIFDVNEKELIEIKLHSKKDYYYDKVMDYIKSGKNDRLIEKLKDFLTRVDKWRDFVKNEPLSELLFQIYHETNYYDFVMGQFGGKQRQANLDLLFERAKQYEHLTSNSLFKFIQLINFLKENDQDLPQARTVSDNEDLVRFMTIHKSKGLEFPIVFMTNLNKKYNVADETNSILFDKHLGITFGYFDTENRVRYETLYQRIIKSQLHKQMLAEEMRLMYVALTRAKERLYLVGTVDDFEKESAKLYPLTMVQSQVLPSEERKQTNYLSLILIALARHTTFNELIDGEKNNLLLDDLDIDIERISSLEIEQKEIENIEKIEFDMSDYTKAFSERLNFEYLHKEKTNHFAKQTIADMKRMNQKSQYSYQHGTTPLKTPKFMDVDKANATLRGTSYHRFMQHIDYKKTYSLEDLKELKNDLVVREIFNQDQIELIDLRKVLNALNKELVQSFKDAIKINKEMPFTTLISSKEVYPDIKDDVDILLQGVVDLFVEMADKCYLIDYKSDRITDSIQDIKRLKKQYQVQMDVYKKAMQNIYEEKPIKAFLYLFEINKFIEM